MKKIDEIWKILEADPSYSGSLLLRRYSRDAPTDIFIAIHGERKERCLGISVGNALQIGFGGLDDLEEIKVEVVADPLTKGKNLILIQLQQDRHRDIFSVLCEDLIFSVEHLSEEARIAKAALNRLSKWKSLFDSAASQGLTPEKQRGLFGELYFLRELLRDLGVHMSIVKSWVGMDKEVRDFQSGDWAVEVKTSAGNNHQRVKINGERQLDPTNFANLFLFHLSLESLHGAGESLCQLVESLRELCKVEQAALTSLDGKLIESSYFGHQSHLYEATGYKIRKESCYRVEGGFPRIEEKDVRAGVGDVSYTIVLSECSSYLIEKNQLLKSLFYE